ncbi:MAG TPA: DUF1883 domain-containing protein [Tepidisphaeraceae bacterium]
MNYLHYEFDAGPEDVIQVTLDKAANVQLMDSANYENYRRHADFHYHGGYVKVSPYQLVPPAYGHWHIVIDLGGQPGTVRASAKLLPHIARALVSNG